MVKRSLIALGVVMLVQASVWADPYVNDQGRIARVSIGSEDAQGNKGSGAPFGAFTQTNPTAQFNDAAPALSVDGRYVAFSSLATNLVRFDPGNIDDIFVRDRDPDANGVLDEFGRGRTVKISFSTDGTAGDAGSFHPAISRDGRFVAFASDATNLVAGDTNGNTDVFVRDRDADGNGFFDEVDLPGGVKTIRASVSTNGAQTDGPHAQDNWAPSVSSTGRFVAFTSWASGALMDDSTNPAYQCGPSYWPDMCSNVFVRDRDADGNGVMDEANVPNELPSQQTILVSAAADGTPGDAPSGSGLPRDYFSAWAPAMSPDGRFVAFSSAASNLAPGDTNGAPDIFIRNRDVSGSGAFDAPGNVAVERIPPPESPTGGRIRSFNPAISPDGRYVAYEGVDSHRLNDYWQDIPPVEPGFPYVGENDIDTVSFIYVYDRTTGINTRIFPSRLGTHGEARAYGPSLSDDGRFVAFTVAEGESSYPAPYMDNGDRRTEVVLHDRDADADGVFDESDVGATATITLSRNSSGMPASGSSYGARVSPNGALTGFISFASDLGPSDSNSAADVYSRQRGKGQCVNGVCV